VFRRRIARFAGYGCKTLFFNDLDGFSKGYQQAYQQKTGITLRLYGALMELPHAAAMLRIEWRSGRAYVHTPREASRAGHVGMGADAFEPNRAGKRKKSYGGPHVSLKCESVIADRLFHEPAAFHCGTGLGSPESLLRFVAGA
jgi:hypothetical protein